MMVSIIMVLAACGGNTYEIDREVSIEFEGYDEHGEAIIDVDKGLLLSNLNKELNFKNNNDMIELETVIANLEVTATPNENLKNDDAINLELLYDEDNSIKLKLTLEDPKITVKGLEVITELSQDDIFTPVELTYEGVSPFLKVVLTRDSSDETAKLFDYAMLEPKEYNRVDEGIEVTAEPKIDLLSEGYSADEADFTNTIKIPAQQRYVEKWDELNKEDQAYILEEIQEYVESKVEKMDGSYLIDDRGKIGATTSFIKELGKAKRQEAYFLFVDEDRYENLKYKSRFVPSTLRVIYKGEVTTKNSAGKGSYNNGTYEYYTVVGAEHLIVDENDELVRAELKVDRVGTHDMHKKTAENDNIMIYKEDFTVEEVKLDK